MIQFHGFCNEAIQSVLFGFLFQTIIIQHHWIECVPADNKSHIRNKGKYNAKSYTKTYRENCG